MVNVLKCRFLAGLTITLMMIASFLAPFADVSRASETITVEEAIKHNEGHAAVEGYVVGHTVSSGHYRFSGNFALTSQSQIKKRKHHLRTYSPCRYPHLSETSSV